MKIFPLTLNVSTAEFAFGKQKCLDTYRKFAFIATLFAVCFLFNISSSVYAATFVVNTTNDTQDATAGNGICADAAGACSLRAAITEANALAGADIITLPAGTYTQTLVGADNTNVAGDFDITSPITINGAGSGTTFVEAAATAGTAVERVFHIIPTAASIIVINDITIRNGRQTNGSFGAGMRVENNANTTLNRVVVRDNQNNFTGGGVYATGAAATLTLNNSTVTANTVNAVTSGFTGTGGGIFSQTSATVNINNSTISNNSAQTSGAVTTGANGGGIYFTSGIYTVTNSTIAGNSVTSSVAGTSGGGIAEFGGTLNITGSTISNNSATGTGFNGVGGGITNQQATLTITNSTVSNNAATFRGGVYTIASAAATTTINSSAIVNNGNSAGVLNLEGGGLGVISVGAANATLNLNNSTVGGNAINGTAAGIETFVTAAGNAITNINYSTVAGNAANVTNNANDFCGGVCNFGQQTAGATGVSTVNLRSSIVADNSDGNPAFAPDIIGVITSANYNHIENTANGTFVPMANDVTGTDPGLTALALNGGTTLNYLPGTGSPVLDTIPNGTNGCGTAPFNVDQRSVIRPTDSNSDTVTACEKGAVEVVGTTAAAVSINGRVLNGGRGLANARVELTGTGGKTRTVVTNAFGNFTISDVEAGATYVVNVSAKRYTFAPQVISVTDSISGLTFTAQ